jgi:hypothetical protein
MLKYYCDVCGSEVEVEKVGENLALFYGPPKGGFPPSAEFPTIKDRAPLSIDIVRFPFTVCSDCLQEKTIIQIIGILATAKVPELFRKEKILEYRVMNTPLHKQTERRRKDN